MGSPLDANWSEASTLPARNRHDAAGSRQNGERCAVRHKGRYAVVRAVNESSALWLLSGTLMARVTGGFGNRFAQILRVTGGFCRDCELLCADDQSPAAALD